MGRVQRVAPTASAVFTRIQPCGAGLVYAALLWAAVSCSTGKVEPTLARPAHEATAQPDSKATSLARHSTEYVVAAGLTWLVVLDVQPLLTNLTRLAPQLLPPNNVQAFERSLGVDLHQLRDVSIAGFEYATLYVAHGVNDVDRALARFTARLAIDPQVSEVGETHLYTGLFDGEVAHYATLTPNTALWSWGDPTPAKAALLVAQRRLRRSPPALRGASLGLLPATCTRGDVVGFVPGPIHGPKEANSNVSLALGATLALSIGATIEVDTLVVRLCWLGDWGGDGVSRTRKVLDAVLNSRFATLLELTPQERQGSFTADNERVFVEYRWAAARVAKRMQDVLSLDLEKLFSEPHL